MSEPVDRYDFEVPPNPVTDEEFAALLVLDMDQLMTGQEFIAGLLAAVNGPILDEGEEL